MSTHTVEENKACAYQSRRVQKHELDHLLKTGVVPGVLENFDVKGVLNFSSTAHTIPVICTCKKAQEHEASNTGYGG